VLPQGIVCVACAAAACRATGRRQTGNMRAVAEPVVVKTPPDLLPNALARHEDAIAGKQLVVAGAVPQLDDFRITNGQDDTAAARMSRPTQHEVPPGRPVGEPAGRDDAVQDRLAAIELEGAWRIYLSQNVIHLAHPRHDANDDWSHVLVLGVRLHRRANQALDFLRGFAGHDDTTITPEV